MGESFFFRGKKNSLRRTRNISTVYSKLPPLHVDRNPSTNILIFFIIIKIIILDFINIKFYMYLNIFD